MKKRFFVVIFTMLVHVSPAIAWWSVDAGDSTHYKLTESARQKLAIQEFPDVMKYGNDISDWTEGKTDDGRAHNPNSENPNAELNPLLDGGPIHM